MATYEMRTTIEIPDGMYRRLKARAATEGPLRRIYMQPNVTDEYQIEFTEPDIDGIVKFLCDERQFSRERVTSALERAVSSGAVVLARSKQKAKRSGEASFTGS